MCPILQLNIQVTPHHRPKRFVIPRPHQIHDGPIAPCRRSELVHLNPIECFLLWIVDRKKAERIIVVPPLLVRRNKRLGSKLRAGSNQVLLYCFQTVVFGKTVVNAGCKNLLAIGVTRNFPARCCLASLVVQRLKTKPHSIRFAKRRCWRHRYWGGSHLIPRTTFRAASGIQRFANRRKRNVGMPGDLDRLAIGSIGLKVNHIMTTM